jgi:hypothetical protein
MDKLMSHTIYELSMTTLTIFILYADDIRVLAANKNTDNLFFLFILTCVSIFFLEILLLSLIRTGYPCSFFFWMDLIATLTSFLEIPLIMNNIF